MGFKRWIFVGSLCLLGGFAWAESVTNQYVVSQGDTLSCIAEKFVGYPIYGSGGSLELLQAENPSIENQHVIGKGLLVALPNQEKINQYSKLEAPSRFCSNGKSRLASDEEVQALHQKIDRLEQKIDVLTQKLNEPIETKNDSVHSFFHNRRYYAGFGFLYHRIDGKDTVNNTSANVLSDLSWQIEFGWKTPMRVNPDYFTHIHAHVQYYRYSKDLTGSTVADQSILAPGVHLNVGRFFWDERLSLALYTGVDREFYFFTSQANTIEFDADWIGKIGAAVDAQLVKRSLFNAGLRSSIEFLGLGGFLDDGGWHAGGNLYAGYKQHEIWANFVYGSMSSTNAEFDTYEANLAYRMYF